MKRNETAWWIVLAPAFVLTHCAISGATELDAAPSRQQSPAQLAEAIDRLIEAPWQAAGATPASLADDAAFLRRAYLDLTGNIPSVRRVREFLGDDLSDKRARLIRELLESPGYVRHFTSVWRDAWLQQPDAPQNAALIPGFESWLRSRLERNAGYDEMVRELLTPESAPAGQTPGTPQFPGAFLQAVERSPPSQAGVTARLFLGLNVDCAQCHNHPFARWKKEQFWSYAAFFAPPSSAADDAGRLEIAIPDSDAMATAVFLDGSRPSWTAPVQAGDGRAAVGAWTTSRENPYFARNAVNRLWARFCGAGLIEPLDDQSGQVPASHSELLDELANAFADSGFDLRYLIESIVLSKTYQRSSVAPANAPTDEAPVATAEIVSIPPSSAGERTGAQAGPVARPRLFTHAAVRIMSGEQLYDSLLKAVGEAERPQQRAQFVDSFGRPERPAETQRTILQALQLMNGDFAGGAASLERGRTLRAVAESPFLDDDAKLETLFLAALSRYPTSTERRRLTAHIVEREDAAGRRAALAEVFWALINSNEFGTIH
jgi:hypothetical protein